MDQFYAALWTNFTPPLTPCNAGEGIGEPSLRIDAVALCCFDHQVDEKFDPRDFRSGSKAAVGEARSVTYQSV